MVSVLLFLNELNEDDFELRFDVTFYPVGAIGNATLGALPTASQSQDAFKVRMRKRLEAPLSVVATLGYGTFAIIKRDLPQRAGTQDRSTADYDYPDISFVSSAGGYDLDELLRYEGGYLYWRTEGIYKRTTPPLTERVPNDHPTLVPLGGVPTLLAPGERRPFRDRTYAIFSIVTGLRRAGEPNLVQAAAQRDAQRIAALLDRPDEGARTEAAIERLDALASAAKVALEQRRIAERASDLVATDPAFRTAGDYPRYWAQQLDTNGLKGYDANKPYLDQPPRVRNAIATNTAVLDVLGKIVINLGVCRADDKAALGKLRDAKASGFTATAAGRFQMGASLC